VWGFGSVFVQVSFLQVVTGGVLEYNAKRGVFYLVCFVLAS
jgi:hypothetical protein